MDYHAVRAYCAGKPGTVEDFPFGPDTLVFKVKGKMFALMGAAPQQDGPSTINLKCDPELAEVLRQTFAAVTPGYHMNKRHWNTVVLDGTVPEPDLLDMIDNSYALVVKGLKRADREELGFG